MAIRILERGRSEGPRFRGECRTCRQRIECEQSDGEYVAPIRDDGDFVRVKCSCCGGEIIAYRIRADRHTNDSTMPVQSIYSR